VKAWHFLKGDKTLRYDEQTKVELGVTLKCDPSAIRLCEFGFHASLKPLDTLSYLQWEDAIICLVELGGTILKGDDKVVASERTVIAWCKADDILHEFACQCAESTLTNFEKVYPNDKRPRLAIEAKRKFKRGEITAIELSAAVWSAARSAVWSAVWAAAEAAESAARSAVRSAQNELLESMFLEALGLTKEDLK
jgi:hypothetical protein